MMLELNIILRLEPKVISKFIVNIPINESVYALKQAIYEKSYLHEDTMIIIYGSLCLKDNDPLYAYNICNGATLNVFKNIKDLDVHDLFNVSVAFQALRMSRKYLHIWNNLRAAPELMFDILLKVPELNKDVMAQTLLKIPNKLRKFNTTHSISYLLRKHPSLIPAVLYYSEVIFKKIKAYRLITRYSQHEQNMYNDNIIHNSLEFAVPKDKTPFVFETDTDSQFASQNRWAGQKQINTSGNLMLSRRYLFSNVAQRTLTPDEIDLCAKLQRMNNLGMMNDIRNAAALKLSNCFKTAINLVRKREGPPYSNYGSFSSLDHKL